MNPVLDVPAIAHFTLNHPGKKLTDEAVEAPSGTALLWRASSAESHALWDARSGMAAYGNTRVKLSLSNPDKFWKVMPASGRLRLSVGLVMAGSLPSDSLTFTGVEERHPPPLKNVPHTKFHLRVSFLGDPTGDTQ